MAHVRNFRDLIAYQRARALSLVIHRFTRSFPREDRFELTSQMRRAVYSVSLNIAEGFGVGTTQGTLRHLRIARGSLCEVQAAVDTAGDLEYGCPDPALLALMDETDRVLQALIRSLERKRQVDPV
ncbi:MAG: four helix bundle protein [Phycisphaerales bacterium]